MFEYMIQGPNGPEKAMRPDAATLEAIQNMESIGDRIGAVRELAMQGFTMDVMPDVYGWGVEVLMKQRAAYGYKWVPSALMPPVTVAPGLTVPGMSGYKPDVIPFGAILVPQV